MDAHLRFFKASLSTDADKSLGHTCQSLSGRAYKTADSLMGFIEKKTEKLEAGMRSEWQAEVRRRADRHSSASARLVWSSDSADVLRIGATLTKKFFFLMCRRNPRAPRIITVTYFSQPDMRHIYIYICFCKHSLSINKQKTQTIDPEVATNPQNRLAFSEHDRWKSQGSFSFSFFCHFKHKLPRLTFLPSVSTLLPSSSSVQKIKCSVISLFFFSRHAR